MPTRHSAIVLPLALLVMTACTSPAGDDRLAAGDTVMLKSETDNVVVNNVKPARGLADADWVLERPGTLGRVVDDPGGTPGRSVRVMLLEGEHKGDIGTVYRTRMVKVTGR